MNKTEPPNKKIIICFPIFISGNKSPKAKYLAHPKTEPDYRLGRKHSEFIISLTELGYNFDLNIFKTHLSYYINKKINQIQHTSTIE